MSKPITKLKDTRESKFLNIAELAAKAGVSIGVVSRAENGDHISLGSIKKLAKALGVAPDKLL
jgi:transcriptional regulator with XRE-family HTH domain